jgi:hypothetical protein
MDIYMDHIMMLVYPQKQFNGFRSGVPEGYITGPCHQTQQNKNFAFKASQTYKFC